MYYQIRHRNIGKCYRNVRITSYHQNRHLLLYKSAEQFPSGLDRFLECRKWYIYIYVLVISRYKDDIVVITRDRGGAEVECNNNDIIRV